MQSAPLIGRETELAAVLRLVADPSVRLVSLVGRGGVGKTRLALEVAWTLDASQPGSVGVISLASVPAAEFVAAEIADQLEISILPGLSAVAAVSRRLQGDPSMALVLDNFEHLLDGAGVLADLLDACDQLQLIVTSQAALRLRPERVVRLRPCHCQPRTLQIYTTSPPSPRWRSIAIAQGRPATGSASSLRTQRQWFRCAASWRDCRWRSS